MANNESTNITGNKVNEKLVQQKKEVSIVEDTDGTVRLCTSADTNAPASVVGQKKQFVMQKVRNGYVWGEEQQYLLMENPSPSILDNNDALDFIESTQIVGTSSTHAISVVFCSTDETKKQIYGLARIVSSVGVKRISGTGSVYLDDVVLGVGYLDSSGMFHGAGSKGMPINYSTTSGTYVERTTQLFVNIPTSFSTDGNRLAASVNIYALADSNTTGQVRLKLRRGLADSYIELVMR